jgi:hypothetical protein
MNRAEEANTRMRNRRKQTCVHFTGLLHEACELGISYVSVEDRHDDRTDLPPAYRVLHPCIPEHAPSPECRTRCEKWEILTEEEFDRREAEFGKKFAERMGSIANNICPDHKVKITKSKIGRCVYGSCGCRLYQGDL